MPPAHAPQTQQSADPLLNLLSIWYEAWARQVDIPVEELCPESPDLQQALRKRISTLKRLEQPDATPELPRDFGDRYPVLAELARGGMGIVYAAYDQSLGRTVAVKVIQGDQLSRSAVRQRFLDEARITSQLQHPGIPPIHELGTLPDGRPFLVMKLIEGRTLLDLLRERPEPRHDLPHFLQVFEQVTQTVAFAHSRGVIHRDLKPNNIMVGAFGEVQVMDWGLARAPRPGTETDSTLDPLATLGDTTADPGSQTWVGQVLGTLSYMPPEQANGDQAVMGPPADVFALGAVLCEILTGFPPYRGPRDVVLSQAQRGELKGAYERLEASGVDPELIALCRQCLAPDHQARPAHAGEVTLLMQNYLSTVRDRLRRAEVDRAAAEAQAQEAVRTREMAEARTQEESKRRRFQAALAVVSILALAGAGGVVWWADRVRSTRESEVQLRTQEREFQDRQTRQAIESGIQLSGDLRETFRFDEARHALRQAQELLDDHSPSELRDQVVAAQNDLDFVIQLDDIRMKKYEKWDEDGDLENFLSVEAAKAYEQAFRSRGYDFVQGPYNELAARIATSPIRAAIVDALDDWAICAANNLSDNSVIVAQRSVATGLVPPATPITRQIHKVLNHLEPDPWRTQFRRWETWHDRDALLKLLDDPRIRQVQPGLLIVMAQVLEARELTGLEVLRVAQIEHPRNFWLHVTRAALFLGSVTVNTEPVSEYLAALALRPDHPILLTNYAHSLRLQGDHSSALVVLQKCTTLHPRYVDGWDQTAGILTEMGRYVEAEAAVRTAMTLREALPEDWVDLAWLMRKQQKLPEALATIRHGLRAVDDEFAIIGEESVDEAAVRFEHAQILLALGNAKQARTEFQLGWQSLFAIAVDDTVQPGGHSSMGTTMAVRELIAAFQKLQSHFPRDKKIPQWIEQVKEIWSEVELEPTKPSPPQDGDAARRYAGARQLLERANVAEKNEKLEEALALGQQATRIAPDLAEVWERFADIAKEQNEYPLAFEAIQKANQLAPNTASIQQTRAEVAKEVRNWTVAEDAAQMLMKLGARDSGIDHLVDIYLAKNDKTKAIVLLQQELARGGLAGVNHWIRLSAILKQSGDWRVAIPVLADRVKTHPQELDTHKTLIRAHFASGNLDATLAACRAMIAANPKSHEGYNELRHYLLAKSDRKGAAEACRQAIRLEPKMVWYRYYLAGILWDDGDLDGAQKEYETTIATMPYSVSAYRDLGRLLMSRGDRTRAETLFQKANELDAAQRSQFPTPVPKN